MEIELWRIYMEENLKQLLLKDLCARLKYGTICEDIYGNSGILFDLVPELNSVTLKISELGSTWTTDIDKVKPYLHPMSSMTEEEKKELFEAINKDMNLLEETLDKEPLFIYHNNCYIGNPIHYELDFLISHYFDYRGLIPMGLALEAPKDMYNRIKYKQYGQE